MTGRKYLWNKYILPAFRINRKNGLVLFFCLLLAVIFWLLAALSKNYTTTLEVRLDYYNFPEAVIVSQKLPEKATILVEAEGWELLRLNFSPNPKVLIDVGQKSQDNRISTNAHQKMIADQISDKADVISINPSIIHFHFEKRSKKKVPVKLNANIELVKQHFEVKSPQIQPDSVLISGPASIIDSIHQITTQPIVQQEVNTNLVGEVLIQKPVQTNITCVPEKVEYQFFVEQYTEARIEVPVNLINIPDTNIILLETTTHMNFLIPLSLYDQIASRDFKTSIEVVADYDNKQQNKPWLDFEIRAYPSYLKKVSLDPTGSDFYIIEP